MALGNLFVRQSDHMVESMGPDDIPVVARLHSEGFGRAWSDGEFAALLAQNTVFGFMARRTGQPSAEPVGFVLARLAAGEAEILTIAVAKSKRRKGIGRALMDAVLRHLHSERAEALFLEVDHANRAAIALYRRLGFAEVARRKAYYGDMPNSDGSALVMRLDLR